MKNKNSNLQCPFCGKIIDDKDLKHWRCTKCKKSFKIEFAPKKKYRAANDPESPKEIFELFERGLALLPTWRQKKKFINFFWKKIL